MLLTAQRVRSLTTEADAIHAFLRRHDAPLPPGGTAGGIHYPSARAAPLRLVRLRVHLGTSGNAVDSFLDLISDDDGWSIDELDSAIQEMKSRLTVGVERWSAVAVEGMSTTVTVGRIVVFAWVSARISPAIRPVADEIAALWTEARSLLTDPQVREPLIAIVEETSEGTGLLLDNASTARVRRILGADWQRPRLHIDQETRAAFEEIHGSIYQQFGPLLTGLEEPVIQELGGIRFVDLQTGKIRHEQH